MKKSPSPERPHSPGRNYNYNDSRSPQRSPRGRSPGHGQSNSSPSRGRSGSPRGRDRSEKREAVNRGNNLYIGDLSSKTKTEDLEKKFSKYGKVMNCRLVTDPRAGQSRGFAFITLDTGEGADEAIKYVNGTDLDGSIIRVEKVCYLSILFQSILLLLFQFSITSITTLCKFQLSISYDQNTIILIYFNITN